MPGSPSRPRRWAASREQIAPAAEVLLSHYGRIGATVPGAAVGDAIFVADAAEYRLENLVADRFDFNVIQRILFSLHGLPPLIMMTRHYISLACLQNHCAARACRRRASGKRF